MERMLSSLPGIGRSTVSGSLSVSISANVGTGSITASLDKNLGTSTLTADVTASLFDIPLCGSLADAGLSFKYNQSTGKDQSIGHTSLICGLFTHESILDQTQVFQQPIPPPPPPPPPKPPQPFHPKLYPPSPDEPDGSTPGFGSTASSVPGYEYMYVANATIPEPDSALSLGGMLAGWWLLLRLRRRYRASSDEAPGAAAA